MLFASLFGLSNGIKLTIYYSVFVKNDIVSSFSFDLVLFKLIADAISIF